MEQHNPKTVRDALRFREALKKNIAVLEIYIRDTIVPHILTIIEKKGECKRGEIRIALYQSLFEEQITDADVERAIEFLIQKKKLASRIRYVADLDVEYYHIAK